MFFQIDIVTFIFSCKEQIKWNRWIRRFLKKINIKIDTSVIEAKISDAKMYNEIL